jgi:DNA-binding response OmpR family regulator
MEMKRAAAERKPYRLVLLDCMMPEMDGFTAAERIRQNADFERPAMIMISSAMRAGDAQRCRQIGIARYMTKPVVQSELLEAVAGILEPTGADDDDRRVEPPAPVGPPLRILLAEDGLVNQRVAVAIDPQRLYELLESYAPIPTGNRRDRPIR